MASYLIQGGTTLYLMSQAGGATAITLPTGVTITGAANPCRAVLFGSGSDPYILVVNGLTQDIYIDKYGSARVLNVMSPLAAPTVTTGALTGPSGTLLTGVYTVAETFKIKRGDGSVILETGLGPVSTGSVALATGSLAVNAMPVSGESTVNARGLYRSLSGGNVLYPWFDVDDNTTLSEDRGGADATLSLLPTTAGFNGLPPPLKLITTWKDILWGVPRLNIDHVRWTEPRVFYTWSATNEIIAPPQNTDVYGVTAFIPRRDQLGIARRDRLYQITGDSDDTFARTQVSPNIGCVSQESVVIVRDVAYFLSERGVVEWNSEAIGYVSEAQVDPWFTTDNHFNRSLFSSAQGRYNPDTDTYELLVALLGSSVLNAWVKFDLKSRAWYGPDITALPLSCCASNSERHGYLRATTGFPIAVFGTTNGYLQKRDQSVADDDGQAVAMDVTLPILGDFAPELEKVWLDATLHTQMQAATTGPDVLTVTSSVGTLNADGFIVSDADVTTNAELTTGFQRLDRPGTGRYLSFRFQHSAVGESVRIEGLEIPYAIVGRRDR